MSNGNVKTTQPCGDPTAAGQEKYQILKIEDALSYLDQVKYKFGNQPQVYNDFLDIMKEFKSQRIDVPGVIQRVSNLFKGHPELIVGFNMFLPPGYKIEVQANDLGVSLQVFVPSGDNNIQLTQPTSPHKRPKQFVHTLPQTVSAAIVAQKLHIQQPHPSPIASVPTGFTTPRQRTVPSSGISNAGGGSIRGSKIGVSVLPIGNSSGGIAASPGMGSSTTIVVGVSEDDAPAPPTTTDMVNSQGHALHHISQAHQTIMQAEQGSGNQNLPVEFNHAFSYVYKIKNRFHSQPEKYKRFLEILHAYQQGQTNLREGIGPQAKKVSEAEVYSQVAKLFDQQDDLLREFGQF